MKGHLCPELNTVPQAIYETLQTTKNHRCNFLIVHCTILRVKYNNKRFVGYISLFSEVMLVNVFFFLFRKCKANPKNILKRSFLFRMMLWLIIFKRFSDFKT